MLHMIYFCPSGMHYDLQLPSHRDQEFRSVTDGWAEKRKAVAVFFWILADKTKRLDYVDLLTQSICCTDHQTSLNTNMF